MIKRSFKEFLQDNLSWSDFEGLAEHLGESRKLTTMIVEQSTSPKKLQIEKIVELLQKSIPEVDAAYLEKEFSFCVEEPVV